MLKQFAEDLLNFAGTSIGVAEISHRSPEFMALLTTAESSICMQLFVLSTHNIPFTQGGASSQFTTVILNMLARYKLLYPEKSAKETARPRRHWRVEPKAAEEAHRLAVVAELAKANAVTDTHKYSANGKLFNNIPPPTSIQFSKDPTPAYYCENKTVDGVEFSHKDGHPAMFTHNLLISEGLGLKTQPPSRTKVSPGPFKLSL